MKTKANAKKFTALSCGRSGSVPGGEEAASGPVHVRLAMQPTKEMKTAIELAILLGAKDPLLFGGAIRDTRLGIKPKDYDVSLNIWNVLDKLEYRNRAMGCTFDEYNCEGTDDPLFSMFQAKLYSLESLRDNLSVVKFTNLSVGISNELELRVKTIYKGVNVDLIMHGGERTISPIGSRFGDAPINSAFMDREEHFYAHPMFEEHIKNRIYAVQAHSPEYLHVCERYNRIALRIPDITLVKVYDAQPDPHSPANVTSTVP